MKTIVKFGDGSYGIRKGIFFYTYLDLKNGRYWWSRSSAFFTDCMGMRNRVNEVWDIISFDDYGMPLGRKEKL